MSDQLSLPLSLRDDATLANFVATDDGRRQLVAFARAEVMVDAPVIFLWGGAGVGKSHLVQGFCHHYAEHGGAAQYLPLTELADVDGASLLDGLEDCSLVCADDLQQVAGNAGWERALFNLFNRLAASGHLLMVTADCPPSRLPLALPDLVSRLASGLTFHLTPYDDGDKQAILQHRAAGVGIELTDEVANYLLTRGSRDLDDLMAALKRLDVASLAAQRRVTIPFIKTLFGW